MTLAALLAALGCRALPAMASHAKSAPPRRPAPLAAVAPSAYPLSRSGTPPRLRTDPGLAQPTASPSLLPPSPKTLQAMPSSIFPGKIPAWGKPAKATADAAAQGSSPRMQLERAEGQDPASPAGAAAVFDGALQGPRSHRWEYQSGSGDDAWRPPGRSRLAPGGRSPGPIRALRTAALALALAYAPAALPSTLAQDRPPDQEEAARTKERARALDSLKDIEARIQKFSRGPWLEPGHELHAEAVESLLFLETNLDSSRSLLARGEMELFRLQRQALYGWTLADGPETMRQVLSADGSARAALAGARARLDNLEDELAGIDSLFRGLRGEFARKSAEIPHWRKRIEQAQAWLDQGYPGPALLEARFRGGGIGTDLDHVRRYTSAWRQLGWLRSRLRDSRLSATPLTLHTRLKTSFLLDDAEERIRDGDWRYENTQAWAWIKAGEIRSAESWSGHRLRTLAICWGLLIIPLALLRWAAGAALYKRRSRDILAGRGPEFVAAAQKQVGLLTAEVERALAGAGTRNAAVSAEEAGSVREELEELRKAFSPDSLAAADSRLASWAKDLRAENWGLRSLGLAFQSADERARLEKIQAALEAATSLRDPDGSPRRVTLDWEGLGSWAESLRSRLQALGLGPKQALGARA